MNKKEWSGENYHHYSQVQYLLATNLLKHCSFKGNEKILDVGFGDGKITRLIASHIPDGNILGVDHSVSMIDFARRTYPSENYKNIQFEMKDVLELPYREEFDIVFSFCCLHWVKDQLTALQIIYRSLKPKGLFFCYCPLCAELRSVNRSYNANGVMEKLFRRIYPSYA